MKSIVRLLGRFAGPLWLATLFTAFLAMGDLLAHL